MSLAGLLEEVRARPLPQHVAIIMDGNGRWAKARGLPRTEGHRRGADTVERIARFVAKEKLFPYLTVFAFSTENWDRPKNELDFLFSLLEEFARTRWEELRKNGVQLRILGDPSPFPKSLREALDHAVAQTAGGQNLVFTVALNFGGRWDVLSAARRAMELARSGKLAPEELSLEKFRELLPGGALPDPDLIIRTGGHQRLSNFFLFEAAYTEFYFTKTLWPDFTEEELLLALKDFQGRTRNFGKVRA
ncbi:di-trans,poly-cis-decaprenylcistransferase [Candidatus Bipolaricaulota bacterium]|nr:di-trans,poly-cis-decaprenylcistransferase [Candidatus Bipolaricaulota bacterium]